MATIDHERKRISAILLFYGPPGSGKTTSLYALSRILPPGTHGKVAPLVQGDGRLLRLDYRPHDQELVYGYQVNFRLVTCAGPIDVDLLRPLLSAVDAVMFVADSSPGAIQADVKALELLDRMVRGVQRSMDDLALVFMYNKRDLRDAVEIRTLEQRLNPGGANYIAASAVRGQGVLEALQRLSATVAVDLRSQMQAQGGESAAAASNAKTVAHGTTFEAARRVHGNDDVTSIASDGRAPAQEWDVSVDDDDRTEVNPQDEGWGDQGDDTQFSRDRRRGAPQPSSAAFSREPEPEPLPEPRSAFRAEPLHTDSQWRTPDAYQDGVDADDRTMPGSEVASLVAEGDLVDSRRAASRSRGAASSRSSASAVRVPTRPTPMPGNSGAGLGSGRRAVDSGRTALRARETESARTGIRARETESARTGIRARETESARSSGRLPPSPRPADSARSSQRLPPSRTRPNPATSTGRARRVERESLRSVPAAPPKVVTVEPTPAPEPAAAPAFGANQTQVINALGRSPESWESLVLESGHPMRVPVADLAGYVVSRIGTPMASSRRTVRLPIRATHMDTLVPQDFILEIDFRGGGGPGSGPAVSARKRPVQQERTVPLAWIWTALGVLAIVILIAIFVVNALGN